MVHLFRDLVHFFKESEPWFTFPKKVNHGSLFLVHFFKESEPWFTFLKKMNHGSLCKESEPWFTF